MKLRPLAIGVSLLVSAVIGRAQPVDRTAPALEQTLYFEAESFADQPQFVPYSVHADPSARGGAFVAVEGRSARPTFDRADEGQFVIRFTLARRSWVYVWIRAQTDSRASDGLLFRRDDHWPEALDLHTVHEPLAVGRWLWHYALAFHMEKGSHEVAVGYFEPAMRLDTVAVSTNPAFTPKLAREGCLYLEPQAFGSTSITFDLMDGMDVQLWMRSSGTADSHSATLDGLPLAPLGLPPIGHLGLTWRAAGQIRLAPGAHSLALPPGSSADLLALCSQKTFTPDDDPWFNPVTMTQVAVKPRRPWRWERSYTLDTLKGFAVVNPPGARSRYGGRLDRTLPATGFFRLDRSDGRWRFVDPEGHPWYNVSINHFSVWEEQRPEMLRQFGSEQAWANRTADYLRLLGFTSAAHQEGHTPLNALGLESPLPYFLQTGVMAAFARTKGLRPGAGNQGFPGDVIMPFHPDYPAFCEAHARKMVGPVATDPFLIGLYLDNELPLPDHALDHYLFLLPSSDPGHAAAVAWLKRRGLPMSPRRGMYDEAVYDQFFGYMMDAYLGPAVAAIRRQSGHHLICGVRANHSLYSRPFFEAMGRHSDLTSFNLYMRWTPDPTLLSQWLLWSGKPSIISEWYAKGMDTEFVNYRNAGWVVPDQRSRGEFYQNFALTLMQHPGIVGFNWFRLYDDSRNDVNKGLLDLSFMPYPDLEKAMRDINSNLYPLLDFLERHPLDTSYAAKAYPLR
jgi:hypothetical protein